MAFVLFVLLTATLFVRPAEIFYSLQWNFYLYLAVACLVMCFPQILAQLNWDSLKRQPITLFILALGGMILLSNLLRFHVSDSLTSTFDFGKSVVLYYLLLVGVVDSSARLKQFLVWILLFITVLTSLAVLQFEGIINLIPFRNVTEQHFNEEAGELELLHRMPGTGIFSDPNDLSLILTMGILLIFYKLGDRGAKLRFLWIAPLGLFVYALKLTQSRSGLLMLGFGALVVLWSRVGWKKGLLAVIVGLPVLLALFGGRQTNFDLANKADTGQGRIQLWAEGFTLFQSSPLIGIGADRYVDEVGLVAHNSFVHSFVELGFVGGTLFVGIFYLAIRSLLRLREANVWGSDPEMARLLPYLTAIVSTYPFGLLTLSRAYVVPTYIPIGLAVIYLRLTEARSPSMASHVHRWSLKELGVVGLAALSVLMVWTKFVARWS